MRTVTATLTSSAAKPIIDVTPIAAHTNEMGVFELALDSLCCAYRIAYTMLTLFRTSLSDLTSGVPSPGTRS